MKNTKLTQNNQFISQEDEREYWESRGPLAKGARGQINSPAPKEKRSSFLSVRLSGEELTKLRDIASHYDLGPSTFAQRILVSFIRQTQPFSDKKDLENKTIITMDDLLNAVIQKVSQKERSDLTYMTLRSVKGELDYPTSISIENTNMGEYFKTCLRFLASIAEVANPELKVTLPFNQEDKNVVLNKGEEK
jgi:hypothetical protein